MKRITHRTASRQNGMLGSVDAGMTLQLFRKYRKVRQGSRCFGSVVRMRVRGSKSVVRGSFKRVPLADIDLAPLSQRPGSQRENNKKQQEDMGSQTCCSLPLRSRCICFSSPPLTLHLFLFPSPHAAFVSLELLAFTVD